MQDFLPDYAKLRTDEKISQHAKAIVDMEDQLSRLRELLREEAGRMLDRVTSEWTEEEIVNATRYKP